MTPASGPNECVLLVEDDLDIRETVAELLEMEGYSVALASNGVEALEHLRNAPRLPRVILLDLRMPVMDGWTFREHQLQHPGWATIPVVVLSADRNTTTKAEGFGARRFLQKPLDVRELLAVLSEILKGDPTGET